MKKLSKMGAAELKIQYHISLFYTFLRKIIKLIHYFKAKMIKLYIINVFILALSLWGC